MGKCNWFGGVINFNLLGYVVYFVDEEEMKLLG